MTDREKRANVLLAEIQARRQYQLVRTHWFVVGAAVFGAGAATATIIFRLTGMIGG